MILVKRKTGMLIASFILAMTTQNALANDRIVTVVSGDGITTIMHTQTAQQPVQQPQNLFIPAVYAVEGAWNEQPYDFSKNVPEPISTHDTDYSYETPVGLDELAVAYGGGKQVKSDGKELIDGIMHHVPYKNTLKHTWNVIDGDVDLGVTNLRMNRRNKGVTYKTNHIPLVGEMKGTQIRADAGEDNKLTLTSDRLPFGGRVEGMQFKASVGNDDSNISLRYNQSIDIDSRLNKTHEYQSASQ